MHPGALLLLAALPALGADIRGRLVPNAELNLTTIPLDSRVDLDYGAGSALFQADGSFQFVNVDAGRHIVRPLVPGYAIHSFIVEVPASDAEQPHVQTYYPDRVALPTTEPSLPYPLEFNTMGSYDYYTAPPAMNMIQMFKSPMIMMMVFSAVMALVLPKITASLDSDPELAAEFREQQKAMHKMQSSAMDWSGALSSKLAAGAGDGEQQQGAATPPKQAQAARGGAAKRGGKRR